jgi:hypothetical protein
MKRSLARKSVAFGAAGMLAVGLLSTAVTATAANAATTADAAAAQAHGPSWHTILSLPDGKAEGNAVDTVVATGKTTGWAFLASGPVAYERIGNMVWKAVAFPGKGGAVNVAGATSPNNVWAAYRTAGGTQLDHWNGKKWSVIKSFPGQITGLSVLGPNDVWVFGGLANKTARAPQGVFHFNGRDWIEVTSSPSGGAARTDRDVWAYSGTTVEHFNGSRWTAANLAKLFPAPTPAETTKPQLTGIIALAPNNVYAVGEGPLGAHIANGVVFHYNGRAWTRVAEGGFISTTGQQIASDGEGGLYLSAQNVEGPNLLFHYSAGKVASVALPSSTGFQSGSDSVSQIPGTAEVLSGGSTYNPGNPATNRSVVFQFS